MRVYFKFFTTIYCVNRPSLSTFLELLTLIKHEIYSNTSWVRFLTPTEWSDRNENKICKQMWICSLKFRSVCDSLSSKQCLRRWLRGLHYLLLVISTMRIHNSVFQSTVFLNFLQFVALFVLTLKQFSTYRIGLTYRIQFILFIHFIDSSDAVL